MEPKVISGGRIPCDDCHTFNNTTIPDRYPVPHLQDFAGAPFVKTASFKIDLVRALHRIPVTTDGTPKTVVPTPFHLLKFICMSIGLCTAAQTSQWFIGHALLGLPFVCACIDNLFVDFTVCAEHKPLTFALLSHSDEYNAREIAHMRCISQFTNDIRHIDGTKNEMTDMLSRYLLSSPHLSHGIDLGTTAAEQKRVGCPLDDSVSGLQLLDVPPTTGTGTIRSAV
nr:unnamed protein product [Spirometra erinaceieuropaei]